MVLAIYRTSIFALIPLQFWKWCYWFLFLFFLIGKFWKTETCYWFLLHNFFCDSGGGGCDSRHRYWDGHLPIYQIMLLIARPKALQKVFPFTWLGAALGSWKCDDGVHWLFGIANLEAGTSVNLLQKNLKTQKRERWSARTLLMGVLHWYWWTHKWWRNNSFWLPKVALIHWSWPSDWSGHRSDGKSIDRMEAIIRSSSISAPRPWWGSADEQLWPMRLLGITIWGGPWAKNGNWEKGAKTTKWHWDPTSKIWCH